MILAGNTDPAVAARIGNGVHRTAVQRHRAAHVLAPARHLLAVAGRGQDLREERAEIAAAATANDPRTFLALHAIVDDLRTVYQRLEKSADEAAQDRQPGAVAGLSAQQIRLNEARGRLGNHGAFAPSRGRDQERPMFNLTINFAGGRSERIVGTTVLDANSIPPIGPAPFSLALQDEESEDDFDRESDPVL